MRKYILLGFSGLVLATAMSVSPRLTMPTQAVPVEATVAVRGTTVIPASIGLTDVVYVATGETLVYPLRVGNAVNVNGLLLPPGSSINGEFRPVPGGVRYFANSVSIGGNPYPISATSDLITDFKDPRQTRFGNLVLNGLVGAAAGSPLGPIGAIGGAILGTVIGNVTAPQVVELVPNQTINLYAN